MPSEIDRIKRDYAAMKRWLDLTLFTAYYHAGMSWREFSTRELPQE